MVDRLRGFLFALQDRAQQLHNQQHEQHQPREQECDTDRLIAGIIYQHCCETRNRADYCQKLEVQGLRLQTSKSAL